MEETLDDEALASIRRRNRVIAKANERIAFFERNGFTVSASEGIYGVTINKKRNGVPNGRGYESMTTSEIIPWESSNA
jgi:hypothetical protein